MKLFIGMIGALLIASGAIWVIYDFVFNAVKDLPFEPKLLTIVIGFVALINIVMVKAIIKWLSWVDSYCK